MFPPSRRYRLGGTTGSLRLLSTYGVNPPSCESRTERYGDFAFLGN